MNLRELRDKINQLQDYEKKEIFTILKNKVKYTQNKNGLFFNMSSWTDEIKEMVEKLIIFIEENKHKLKQREEIQNNLIEKSI